MKHIKWLPFSLIIVLGTSIFPHVQSVHANSVGKNSNSSPFTQNTRQNTINYLKMSFNVSMQENITNQERQIQVGGTIVSKPYGFVYMNTTYMPIWYVMQAITKLGIQSAWNGNTWTLTTPDSMAINFNNIPVTTGSTSILINQTLVQKVTPMFGPDPASEINTTYMPIWYVIQVLQRMGIQSSWNGSVWNLTTGGSGNLNRTTRDDSNLTVGNPTSITIFGWVTGESSVADAEKNFGALNQVGVDEFNVNADGSVSGSAPAGLLSKASTNHVSTYATVTNYDSSGLFSGSLIEGILNDSSTVETLIQNLVSLAVNQSFTGINLDFENVPVNDEGSYMQFLAGLASALHDSDKLLNVTVPAETSNPGTGCYGAYNYQVIGQIADTVSVMTYDYTYINNAPGPIAPYLWDKQVMSYAVSQIPSHKVLLGMGAYGYDWSSAGGDATAITLPQIDQMIAKDGIHPSWDSADEVPYFTYISSTGQTHTVYYEDGQSLTDKLALVTQDDLGGVCIWRMGLEDTSLWDAIQTYEK